MRSRAFPDLTRFRVLLLGSLLAGCQPAHNPDQPDAPITQQATASSGCKRCHTAHTAPLPTNNPMMRGLSDLDPARPDGLHSCTSCHGGTPGGSTLEEIHSGGLPFGMIPAFAPNPTSTEAVMYACGMCHRNHVRRVDTSAMNGGGKYYNNINKLPQKRTEELVGSSAYKSYHSTAGSSAGECASACHIFADNDQQGCSSCHMPDGSPLQAGHKLGGQENLIEPASCMQCHIAGHQLASRFLGLEVQSEVPTTRSPWHSIQASETADLHARAGMVCQDCHSSIDIHGDGSGKRGSEIECSDCHGTADKAPWELPLGWMDQPVSAATPARGTTRKLLNFQRHGIYIRNAEHLVTARGNPLQHTARNEGTVSLQSWTEKTFQIPQLYSASSTTRTLHRQHSNKLECYSCHTGLPQNTIPAEAGLLAPRVPGVTYTSGQQVPPAPRYPHDAVAKPDQSCQHCHTP